MHFLWNTALQILFWYGIAELIFFSLLAGSVASAYKETPASKARQRSREAELIQSEITWHNYTLGPPWARSELRHKFEFPQGKG